MLNYRLQLRSLQSNPSPVSGLRDFVWPRTYQQHQYIVQYLLYVCEALPSAVSVLTSALLLAVNQRRLPGPDPTKYCTLPRARAPKTPVASESKMGEHTSDRSANDWVERYMSTPYISSWLWSSGFCNSDASSDLQCCRRVAETRGRYRRIRISIFLSRPF